MNNVRAVFIVVMVLALTLLMLPVHGALMVIKSPLQKRTAMAWHRQVARIMGIHIKVHGSPFITGSKGTLFISNHVSWVDIVVLGAIIPVNFIAKSEVRSWPLFGWLAQLQRTLFVERSRRLGVRDEGNQIRERLLAGDSLVLFPEGTTSDGNFVYPFNSSLLGAITSGVTTDKIPVQSVSIAFNGLGGLPMGRYWRPIAAWPGTVTLAEHLPRVLKEGLFDVEVHFGPVIKDAQMQHRKPLTAELKGEVQQMLASGLRGDHFAAKRS
ncbi:MAG: lysophospholipid acyltransferase family protein [Pseudomonadota bacterium]